jgi:hypothetical protein
MQATPPRAERHRPHTASDKHELVEASREAPRVQNKEQALRKPAERRTDAEAPPLRHTNCREPYRVSSKAASSRRTRRKSADTARSEDLRFSPGACKQAGSSHIDAFKKGTTSMDAAVVAQEGKGFPSAYAPYQLHRVLTVA